MDKFPVQFEYNMANIDIDSILDVFEGENPNLFCDSKKLDNHYFEESDTDKCSQNFAEILAIWSEDTDDETWLYSPGMIEFYAFQERGKFNHSNYFPMCKWKTNHDH